jgi:hypothetical protein
LISAFFWDSFEARVILNVFIYIHSLKNQIVLRRVADKLASLVEVGEQVESAQEEAPRSWEHFIRQTLEGRGLAGTVDAEECEAFSDLQGEREIIDGLEL